MSVNRIIQPKDTIPIFHDEEPQAVYNSYYAEQTSHSKVIIIIVIILLVSVIIMCGLKLVDYYQENHSDNFSAVSSEVFQTNETTETAAITVTEAVKSTVIESNPQTISVEPTEPILTQVIMPEKKVSIISVDNISGYPQYKDILRTYTADERCMLCDLNNDGTAELVITNAGNSILMIYTIFNNEAVFLVDATGNMSGGVSICENGAIIHGFSGGASQGGVMYKQYTGGNSLDIVEEIDIDENGIHYSVGTTTTNITEAQSNEIQNKYKNMYLETVPISSLGLTIPVSSNHNLGDMYNKFYFHLLCIGSTKYGWLEDADGDGADELIINTQGDDMMLKYVDGDLKSVFLGGNMYYGKTEAVSAAELRALCRQKAAENGFEFNSNFTVAPDVPAFGCVHTDGSKLNLRSEPSADSNIIIQLPYGLLMNVLYSTPNDIMTAGNTDWLYVSVQINGTYYTGYVSNEFVDLGIVGID